MEHTNKKSLAETLLSQLQSKGSENLKNTSTIHSLKRSSDSASFARSKANFKILKKVLSEDILPVDNVREQKKKRRLNELKDEIERERRRSREEIVRFRKTECKMERKSRLRTEISSSVPKVKTLFECARLQASWKNLSDV